MVEEQSTEHASQSEAALEATPAMHQTSRKTEHANQSEREPENTPSTNPKRKTTEHANQSERALQTSQPSSMEHMEIDPQEELTKFLEGINTEIELPPLPLPASEKNTSQLPTINPRYNTKRGDWMKTIEETPSSIPTPEIVVTIPPKAPVDEDKNSKSTATSSKADAVTTPTPTVAPTKANPKVVAQEKVATRIKICAKPTTSRQKSTTTPIAPPAPRQRTRVSRVPENKPEAKAMAKAIPRAPSRTPTRK
ncbi:hypothetical protein PV327_011476 [Microctonus hyperodae]|uniref:Uncharacterized protein n=1 Tax=Microctonus hyperodae TaxID=165561 RepID=A0AA39C301_MICHY|nr:hypothetical protein PV327_011476 [Microctonus hyperodae]